MLMLCYGKQDFFRECTVTVGKINLGLKANVLIVPFLVEDIGHTCAHISLVSKAHISGLVFT